MLCSTVASGGGYIGYELNSRHQIEDTGITWGGVSRETTRELEGDLTRGSVPTHLLSSPSTT